MVWDRTNSWGVMGDTRQCSLSTADGRELSKRWSLFLNFLRAGWLTVTPSLQLQMDLSRIPNRNLGRDDRVISSHGKEVRHPFLSLPFVGYVARLPVHHKLDSRLDLGVGDKMILRLAAKQLGLAEASTRKKRAMQFGTHSARMRGGEAERKGDLLLK